MSRLIFGSCAVLILCFQGCQESAPTTTSTPIVFGDHHSLLTAVKYDDGIVEYYGVTHDDPDAGKFRSGKPHWLYHIQPSASTPGADVYGLRRLSGAMGYVAWRILGVIKREGARYKTRVLDNQNCRDLVKGVLVVPLEFVNGGSSDGILLDQGRLVRKRGAEQELNDIILVSFQTGGVSTLTKTLSSVPELKVVCTQYLTPVD